jgi:ABC-2 type transport system ATP-binding protein
MKVAEQLCDTIFMIYHGKKVLDGTLDTIQAKYGEDTILVRTSAEAEVLTQLRGVLRVNDLGREKELRLAPGTDPQSVLQNLLPKARVDRFEIVRPSLHDIFVRIAQPDSNGSANHA